MEGEIGLGDGMAEKKLQLIMQLMLLQSEIAILWAEWKSKLILL